MDHPSWPGQPFFYVIVLCLLSIQDIHTQQQRGTQSLQRSLRRSFNDGKGEVTKHSILKAFQLGFQGERKSLDKGLLTGLLWNPNSLQGSDQSSVGYRKQAKRIGNRPTLFLELFGRTDRRKPINRLQTPLLEISLSLCLNRAVNQMFLCRNDLAVLLLPYTKRVYVKTERKVMGKKGTSYPRCSCSRERDFLDCPKGKA